MFGNTGLLGPLSPAVEHDWSLGVAAAAQTAFADPFTMCHDGSFPAVLNLPQLILCTQSIDFMHNNLGRLFYMWLLYFDQVGSVSKIQNDMFEPTNMYFCFTFYNLSLNMLLIVTDSVWCFFMFHVYSMIFFFFSFVSVQSHRGECCAKNMTIS